MRMQPSRVGGEACVFHGRLMLVGDQLDLLFELALSDVLGADVEPDDKDGMFLS